MGSVPSGVIRLTTVKDGQGITRLGSAGSKQSPHVIIQVLLGALDTNVIKSFEALNVFICFYKEET